MCVTVLCGLLCCSLAVSVVPGTAAVASALEPDPGKPSGGSWPVAPTHGNVDVNGDVGQGQAVAPWTSSQLPAQEEGRERSHSAHAWTLLARPGQTFPTGPPWTPWPLVAAPHYGYNPIHGVGRRLPWILQLPCPTPAAHRDSGSRPFRFHFVITWDCALHCVAQLSHVSVCPPPQAIANRAHQSHTHTDSLCTWQEKAPLTPALREEEGGTSTPATTAPLLPCP